MSPGTKIRNNQCPRVRDWENPKSFFEMNAVISNEDPRGFFHAIKDRERYFQAFVLKISNNVEKH